MSRGRSILMLIGTAAAVSAAVFAVRARAPESLPDRQPVFPGLAERLNDVQRIELRRQQQRVGLNRGEQGWVISSSGYPARYREVRNSLVALSQLEILEYKTDNPDLYARLEVEDPDSEGARSTGLRVFAGDDRLLAELIVGRSGSQDRSAPRFYVRRPEHTRALLVGGALRLGVQSRDWMETLVLDLPKERIREIDYRTRNGRQWRIFRSDPEKDFELEPIPEGHRLRSQGPLGQTAAALEQTHVENAFQAGSFEFGPEKQSATYRTFDGLSVQVTAERRDNRAYAAFRVEYEQLGMHTAPEDPEVAAEQEAQAAEVRAEAKRLTAALDTWAFEVPLFKYLGIFRNPSSLTREEEAEDAAAAPDAPPVIPGAGNAGDVGNTALPPPPGAAPPGSGGAW